MNEGYVRVPPTKVIETRRGETVRHVITKDVTDWARGEVILLMRREAIETVAQQTRLDNPPTLAVIDKTRGKPIREAVRTVDISFGNTLKAKALAVVETELRRAIARSTKRQSGRLESMSNWKWTYSYGNRVQPLPLMGASGIPMGPNDFLVLSPRGVPHATVTNRRIAREGGALSTKRRSKGGELPPPAPGVGFFGYAVKRARRHPALSGFRVAVRLSARHAVAGELSKRRETYSIIITPERGRFRR